MRRLLLLCSVIEVIGKGSPAGSSYSRTGASGTYGAAHGSRYMLYPAVGAYFFLGSSRRYRSSSRYRSDAMKEAQLKTWSYVRFQSNSTAGFNRIAEVQFFGNDALAPMNVTPAAGFEYLNDAVQTAPAGQPTQLDIVFAVSPPQVIKQYQIGAATTGPVSAAWEISAAGSASGPWSLLDSTFGNFSEIPAADFVVTTLETQCPFGYTAYSNASNTTQREVNWNTQSSTIYTSSTDLLKCATLCDSNGLACTSYTAKLSTVDSLHCNLYGADYTLRENGNPIQTTAIPEEEAGQKIILCHKAGLVDCMSSTCQTVVPSSRRRLQELDIDAGFGTDSGRSMILTKPLATLRTRSHFGRRGYFFGEGQSKMTVRADLFFCENGQTIERQFVCDHIDDCGDGSDEANPFPCAKRFEQPSEILASLVPQSLQDGILQKQRKASAALSPSQVGQLVFVELPFEGSHGWEAEKEDSDFFTLDLGKTRELMMVALQNSKIFATKRFELQISPNLDDIACEDTVNFVTVAKGPLPAPNGESTYGADQTTELLLQGYRTRCIRFVAVERFRSTAPGLGHVSIYESQPATSTQTTLFAKLFVSVLSQVTGNRYHQSAITNGEKEQQKRLTAYSGNSALEVFQPFDDRVESGRRLAEEPTTSTCKECPTFDYDETNVGAMVGGLVIAFLVIGYCCWAGHKKKMQNMKNSGSFGDSSGARMNVMGGTMLQQAVVAQPISQPSMPMMVMCPDGVSEGQMIQVCAPDGTLLSVTVPPGVGPGIQFGVHHTPAAAPQGHLVEEQARTV